MKVAANSHGVELRSEDALMTVTSGTAQQYAEILEHDPEVVSYETQYELMNLTMKISLNGIRKNYLEERWQADFYIVYTDSSVGIQEIVTVDDLAKKSEIEKLEMPRRYWAVLNVENWKIVVIDKVKKEGSAEC